MVRQRFLTERESLVAHWITSAEDIFAPDPCVNLIKIQARRSAIPVFTPRAARVPKLFRGNISDQIVTGRKDIRPIR